ncbi:hypothetical protein KSC_013610 [Ktedonobacter sp. SOSP1-52]|uniref:DUF4334 domain-containing protein n=1 Tax=Ktedonobacter sp. SOSP1-52 TaxID=2778366 RepID=UPI001915F0E3|nr:DUF4334 domain-containing protein [Ktedonobacter sp. SOSP1-52]GHO62469.1 hypothetical protein KSC_013610 [Ktedonobacter sp. SOSP1-52]
MTEADELRERAYQNRMSLQEALELCDALPGVEIETMLGRWRGSEVSTHHPMDGMLEAFGWYGKEFIDRDHVHPLLFSDNHNQIFAIDPKRLPLSLVLKLPIPRNKLMRRLVIMARFLLQTRQAKARVRMVEYRGKVSASMLYDNLPICDTFRLIDQDTLLGIMDFKGMEQPFFFKLHRDK